MERLRRFIEGRAGNRLLRGAAKVIDRLGIVATTVMMSEFGQMVVERTCIKRFERRADALVQLLAPLHQDRVVGDLRHPVFVGLQNPSLKGPPGLVT